MQFFDEPLVSQHNHPERTRFAPSPTGYLHLGHIVSAMFVWGLAKASSADVLLRIEDHDQTRWRQEYETTLLRDLEWLGFYPSLGTTKQSQHFDRYEHILHKLLGNNLAYYCACTRKQIFERTGSRKSGELFYDNYCREKNLAPSPNHGIRLKVSPKTFHFNDELLGSQTQTPSQQCGDFLIRDRAQCFTYQFCVSIDDMVESMTLIVRGQDLLESTGRQMYLHELVEQPRSMKFYHHPLLTTDTGNKLSKRHFSEAIAKHREAGMSSQELLGRAAYAAGIIKTVKRINLCDVGDLLSDAAFLGKPKTS